MNDVRRYEDGAVQAAILDLHGEEPGGMAKQRRHVKASLYSGYLGHGMLKKAMLC